MKRLGRFLVALMAAAVEPVVVLGFCALVGYGLVRLEHRNPGAMEVMGAWVSLCVLALVAISGVVKAFLWLRETWRSTELGGRR